ESIARVAAPRTPPDHPRASRRAGMRAPRCSAQRIPSGDLHARAWLARAQADALLGLLAPGSQRVAIARSPRRADTHGARGRRESRASLRTCRPMKLLVLSPAL